MQLSHTVRPATAAKSRRNVTLVRTIPWPDPCARDHIMAQDTSQTVFLSYKMHIVMMSSPRLPVPRSAPTDEFHSAHSPARGKGPRPAPAASQGRQPRPRRGTARGGRPWRRAWPASRHRAPGSWEERPLQPRRRSTRSMHRSGRSPMSGRTWSRPRCSRSSRNQSGRCAGNPCWEPGSGGESSVRGMIQGAVCAPSLGSQIQRTLETSTQALFLGWVLVNATAGGWRDGA